MNIFEGKFPKPFYKKPIDKLNRDLTKLIIIDSDARAFTDFPDNGLLMPKYEEDQRDLALYDLTLFLQQLSNKEIDDVRPVIRHYSKFGDKWLEEFRKAQYSQEEEETEAAPTQTINISSSSF